MRIFLTRRQKSGIRTQRRPTLSILRGHSVVEQCPVRCPAGNPIRRGSAGRNWASLACPKRSSSPLHRKASCGARSISEARAATLCTSTVVATFPAVEESLVIAWARNKVRCKELGPRPPNILCATMVCALRHSSALHTKYSTDRDYLCFTHTVHW